jgi:hypothetical protein
MSHVKMRLLVILLLLAAFATVELGSSAASEPQDVRVNVPIPCDPVITRTITPLIVEQGGEVVVQVQYNFKCTGQNRKINYFFVVEGTGALRPGGKLDLLQNLKKGLTNFVNNVDYSNGSMGGLTVYADDYNNRVTLLGGEQGRQSLLNAIGLISAKPVGAVAGVAGAVRDATQRLPTGVNDPDVTNVLIIVDAGAQIPSSGPTMSNLNDSCDAARKAGVLMILVGLRPAGNRLGSVGCVTSGWFRYSPTEDGSDLPGLFSGLAERLVKGKKADKSEYYDDLQGADFSYVVGSGAPFDGNNTFGNEWSWEFPPPGPAGQTIQYRAKVVTESVPVGGKMTTESYETKLCLTYKDGTNECTEAPNPDICIYRKGVPSDCDKFRVTLTPPATPSPTGVTTPETPTPTEAPSDTPVVPTDTPTNPAVPPTDTPTPTPPPRPTIYLPISLQSFGF